MAALDFPSNPSIGDNWPTTPQDGVPTYVFDGEKWTTVGQAVTSALPGTAIPLIEYASGNPGTSPRFSREDHTHPAVVMPAPIVPTGTVMVFYQANAPTGWTKITTQTDKALRVINSSGGSAGGTNAFSTVMAQAFTGYFTLDASTIPAHTHGPQVGGYTYSMYAAGGGGSPGSAGGGLTGVTTTGSIGSSGAHRHGITMDMQYINVILASKD